MRTGLYRGGAFLHLNTNKRSTVLDPATVNGRERLGELIDRSRSDHRGNRCGASSRRGGIRGAPCTSERRVFRWCASAGSVRSGPYAGYQWDDLIAQAVSNNMIHDRTNEAPVRFPGHLGLCVVANLAALGALGAVLSAEATGIGCFVDCAATEALSTIPARATTLLSYRYRDGAPGPNLYAGARESLLPLGVYPCGDGYVAMMSTPQQLDQMLEVLDDENLYAAFARPDAFERGETKEAIDAALYPWLLSRTRAEATAEAQRVGWPLAGVNEPSEVIEADHLAQRGFWVHADDPAAGSIKLPGAPYRFAEGGWSLRRLAPRLGEHDAEVAAELRLPPAEGGSKPPARAVSDSVPSPSSPPLARDPGDRSDHGLVGPFRHHAARRPRR